MQEACTAVIGLWEQIYASNPDPAAIKPATDQLNQYMSTLDSIVTLLTIYDADTTPVIKRRSIVYLMISINKHLDELKNHLDLLSTVSQKLLEILQTELDLNTKCIACQVTYKIFRFSGLNLADLLSFSSSLLQNPSKNIFYTGLALITPLIDDNFPPDLVDSLMAASLEILANTHELMAQSNGTFTDLQKIATELITGLLSTGVFDSVPEKLTPLSEYLIKGFDVYFTSKVISAQTDKEKQIEWRSFFDIFAVLISYDPEYFMEHFTPVLEAIIANLSNDSLDLFFRISSLSILTPVASFIPEIVISNLLVYLMQTIYLSLAAYNENKELQSIYLPVEFYQEIGQVALDEIESTDLYGIICSVIQQISSIDNISKYLAIFMLIDAFEPCIHSELIEQFSVFIPIVDSAIETNDRDTIEAAASFLRELSNDETLICIILDTFEPKLLSFLESDVVLETLEEIYRLSNKSRSLAEYTQSLTSLLNQFSQVPVDPYHIEKVIGCIAYLNLLICPDSPDAFGKIEECFSHVRPFLLQMFGSEDPSLIGPAIFCFSTFGDKNHLMIKDDIPSLADVIIKSIPMKSPQLTTFCANAIINFIDFFKQSFAQYCPTIFSALVEVIGNREADTEAIAQLNDDDNDDDFDDEAIAQSQRCLQEYSTMYTEVLAAVAHIFISYSEQMADQSDAITQILLQTIHSTSQQQDIESYYQAYMRACGCVIPAFVSIKKDPSQFIDTYLTLANQFTTFDAYCEDIIEFWDNLAIIISKCGTQFLMQYGKPIFEHFVSVFNLKQFETVYSKSKKKFILRSQFVKPITTFGCQFFYQYGGYNWMNLFADPESRQVIESANPSEFAQVAVAIVETMAKHNKAVRAAAARFLSVIITSCSPNYDSLLQNVLQLIIPGEIQSNDYTSRENAYDALNHIIFRGNQQYLQALAGVENLVPNLLQNVLQIICEDDPNKYPPDLVQSANNLWCGLVMAYNLDVSPEIFAKVLSYIPPKPHSSYLEYTVQFAIYAHQKWPEQFTEQSLFLVGLSIFASDDNFIRKVRAEHMSILAGILQKQSQEVIISELQSDENMIMTLQRHLQMINQLTSS